MIFPIFAQILLKAGAIPCNEFLSHDSYSKIYFCLVIMGLSLVYGVWTALVYIRSPVVKLRQEAVTRNIEEYAEIWIQFMFKENCLVLSREAYLVD